MANERVRVISRQDTWEEALSEAVRITRASKSSKVVAVRTTDAGYVVGQFIGPYSVHSETDIFPALADIVQMYPMITEGAELMMTPDPDAPGGMALWWESPSHDDTKETST